MDKAGPVLSLIVPAYNEEKRIGAMLEAYLPYFASHYPDRLEVWVIVNGTTDRTAEKVSEFQPCYPFLKIHVEPLPVGKGGAIVEGFSRATGEIVGFVDADGATPPETFDDLVRNLGGAGVLLASRWLPESRITPQPLARRVASRIFNRLVRLLFDLPITDTQCGAKVLRREVVRAILPNLGTTRWAFDVDLLFQARRAGYEIREIPTLWNDKAGSRLKVGRASVEMSLALVRLRLLYSPFRFLVPVGHRILGWFDWSHRSQGN
jgi:glycosyltransferase involved in cell wall biosynthesis